MREAKCPPESGGQRDREADPARGGSLANLVRMRLWNHPPHDRDEVAVVLPSLLRRAISEPHFERCRELSLRSTIFVGPSIPNPRSPTLLMGDLIVIAMLGGDDGDLRQWGVQNWQKMIETFRDIDESLDPKQ